MSCPPPTYLWSWLFARRAVLHRLLLDGPKRRCHAPNLAGACHARGSGRAGGAGCFPCRVWGRSRCWQPERKQGVEARRAEQVLPSAGTHHCHHAAEPTGVAPFSNRRFEQPDRHSLGVGAPCLLGTNTPAHGPRAPAGVFVPSNQFRNWSRSRAGGVLSTAASGFLSARGMARSVASRLARLSRLFCFDEGG